MSRSAAQFVVAGTLAIFVAACQSVLDDSPVLVKGKPAHECVLGCQDVPTSLSGVGDTLWANPSVTAAGFELTWSVADLNSYVSGKLDTATASQGGTGNLMNGTDTLYAGNNYAFWSYANTYRADESDQWAVMETASTGGLIIGYYGRDLRVADTVGIAWMSVGGGETHAVVISTTQCTDYVIHTTHCY